MTQFVIAQNSSESSFFTTASSYERPEWTKLTEATKFHSIDRADKARIKLIKNGYCYSATIIQLSEQRIDQPTTIGAFGTDSFETSDSQPQSEMTADDTEEPCETCHHEPCTCEDTSDDYDDVDSDVDRMVDDQLDKKKPGLPSDQHDLDDGISDGVSDGDADSIEHDGSSDNTQTLSDIFPDYNSLDGESTTIDGDTNADNDMYSDTGRRFTPKSMSLRTESAESDKFSVPSEVISKLTKAIKKWDIEVKDTDDRDDTRASFAKTVAEAFKTLKHYLEVGTIDGFKKAQIEYSSWMNVITSHLPVEVVKFITSGGQKTSLKEKFDRLKRKQ